MQAKKILTAVLLLFVAVSLVQLVVKHIQLNQRASVEKYAGNKVVVYYFHSRERCDNCRMIEAYAKESVQSAFEKELAEGSIDWQVVNFDEPANGHFDKEYELGGIPSVVLVRIKDGTRVKSKNLTDVWEYVTGGEKTKFLNYVQSELRDFVADKSEK